MSSDGIVFFDIDVKCAKFYRIFYVFLKEQKIVNVFAIFFMEKSQIVVDIAQGIV